MRNALGAVLVILIIVVLGVGLGELEAQNNAVPAEAPAKAAQKTAPEHDRAPELSAEAKLKIRDIQVEYLQNEQQVEALKKRNAELQTVFTQVLTESLNASKVDPQKWTIDLKTLSFVPVKSEAKK